MNEAAKRHAIVTGSASGLGACIALALRRSGWVVEGFDIVNGDDVTNPPIAPEGPGVDLLVNCAGVNGIDWLKDVTEADWDRIMDTNAKGIFLMTQAYLPRLRLAKGTVVNVVSNAAHMPMRCSAAYNASKGAALILSKQLARELAPDVTVFSVSPNKLCNTGMSAQIDEEVVRTRGWTHAQAVEYQKAGLLIGEETPPEAVADFIDFLVSTKSRHKYLAGCDIPYGV